MLRSPSLGEGRPGLPEHAEELAVGGRKVGCPAAWQGEWRETLARCGYCKARGWPSHTCFGGAGGAMTMTWWPPCVFCWPELMPDPRSLNRRWQPHSGHAGGCPSQCFAPPGRKGAPLGGGGWSPDVAGGQGASPHHGGEAAEPSVASLTKPLGRVGPYLGLDVLSGQEDPHSLLPFPWGSGGGFKGKCDSLAVHCCCRGCKSPLGWLSLAGGAPVGLFGLHLTLLLLPGADLHPAGFLPAVSVKEPQRGPPVLHGSR